MATTTVVAVFDASDLKKGFKEFEQGMSGAKKGARELGGLLGSLSSEMGTVGRTLGALGSALASGSVFGLAAAGILLLVEQFKKAGEEAKKMTKEYVDGLKSIVDTAIAQGERASAAGSVGLLKGQIYTAEQAILQLRKEENKETDRDRRLEITKKIKSAEVELTALKLSIAGAELRQWQAEQKVKKVANDAELAQALSLAKASKKVREDSIRDAKTTELDAKAASTDQITQLERTFQKKIEDIDRKIVDAKKRGRLDEVKLWNAARQAELDSQARQLNQLKQMMEMADLKKPVFGPGNDAGEKEFRDEQEKNAPIFGPGSPLGEAEFEMARESQAKIRAEVEKTAAAYQQWGQVAGNVIGGLITGQMSLGQAMATVANTVIQSVIQSAIASITADAARAGAGAAASQAGIPVIGPVLAISAMGAMVAAVMGLLSSVPGKALGGPVTFGQPYIVGEVGPELFIPGSSGNIVPNSALGGKSSSTNIFISALDSKSFERSLRDNESTLMSAINDVTRRGRG